MTHRVPIHEEVERLSSYLASLSFTVTPEWLLGCVEYFREENQNYSVADLQEFVRKQWELSDLRDSSVGSLPHNLQSQIKVTLRGKYAVQIESVINISQPAYGQMLRIRKVDSGNVEATERRPESWEPRGSRMLKLKVCDGPQHAEAIEYRPLQVLNEHILPGTKILIMGPVDCRRGIFFLKPENVKIIGGEVDSLLIPNHMENVLARVLGLPENPDPLSANTNDVTQSTTTSISDTQRSTYTPAVAPTPVPSREMNGGGGQVATRNTLQRSVQDYFRSKPPEEPAAEILNDLDVTDWTMDDLLADGDEAFLQIPEETEIESVNSHTSEPYTINSLNNRNTTTNSDNNRNSNVNSINSRNNMLSSNNNNRNISASPLENRQLPYTNQGNSQFKVPQIPPNNTVKSNCGQSSSKESKNPFLASDDYLESFEMDEWDDEEMSAFISAPSKPNDDTSNNKQVSVGTSGSTASVPILKADLQETHRSASSKVSSSFKWPNMPRGNVQTKLQFSAGRSVVEQQQKNKLNTCNSNASTVHCVSNRTEQMEDWNSELPNQSSVKTMPQRNEERNTESQWRSAFSRRPTSKLFHHQEEMPKNVNLPSRNKTPSPKTCNKISPVTPPPTEVFEYEDDWGDAYLNSQNDSFLQKFDVLNKSSYVESPINPLKVSPTINSLKASKTTDIKLFKPLISEEPVEPSTSRSLINPSDFSPASIVGTSRPSNIMDEIKFPNPSTSRDSTIPDVTRQDYNVSDGTSFNQNNQTERLRPALSSPSLLNNVAITSPISPKAFVSGSKRFVGNTTMSSNTGLSHKITAPSKYTLKSPEPFVYLISVLQAPTKLSGTHRIKATIMSLLSPLKTNENLEWTLSAKICDGTSSLDVRFSSEVLDELIGLSAQEFKKMKKDLPRNPLLKDKLLKTLEKSRQTLINLNCLFDIQFGTDKMAEVVKLTEITAEDVNKLKFRMNTC